MLECGADTSIKDNYGKTAFNYLAKKAKNNYINEVIRTYIIDETRIEIYNLLIQHQQHHVELSGQIDSIDKAIE
ncbi:MAG: hypothetical protein U1E31_01870 [Rickettsiales bacterium]